MSAQGFPMLLSEPQSTTRSSCTDAQGEHQTALLLEEHPLPHRLFSDLLVGALAIGLIGGFIVLAQTFGAMQPMLLLVMPIPLAGVLIMLIVVHDRRAAGTM